MSLITNLSDGLKKYPTDNRTTETSVRNKGRRWRVRIAVALAALFVCALTGCIPISCDTGGGPGGDGPGTGAEQVHGCCDEGPPEGYVKVDKVWSPTTCGKPIDSNVHNSCTYQQYTEKPLGTIMDICNDQAPPDGWEAAPTPPSTNPDGTFWGPTKCGSPVNSAPNMLKIKKTS